MSSVCGYHYHNEMCIAYTAIALFSEVNSIFLHARKLLKLQSASHGPFYYCLCAVNVVTFIFFRFIPMYIVGYGILTDYHKVPRGYHIFLTVMSIVVMIINFGLFYQLISSDYRDFKRKKLKHNAAAKKAVAENMDDNNHYFQNNNLKVE